MVLLQSLDSGINQSARTSKAAAATGRDHKGDGEELTDMDEERRLRQHDDKKKSSVKYKRYREAK